MAADAINFVSKLVIQSLKKVPPLNSQKSVHPPFNFKSKFSEQLNIDDFVQIQN
jgi:hypothetical protein